METKLLKNNLFCCCTYWTDAIKRTLWFIACISREALAHILFCFSSWCTFKLATQWDSTSFFPCVNADAWTTLSFTLSQFKMGLGCCISFFPVWNFLKSFSQISTLVTILQPENTYQKSPWLVIQSSVYWSFESNIWMLGAVILPCFLLPLATKRSHIAGSGAWCTHSSVCTDCCKVCNWKRCNSSSMARLTEQWLLWKGKVY